MVLFLVVMFLLLSICENERNAKIFKYCVSSISNIVKLSILKNREIERNTKRERERRRKLQSRTYDVRASVFHPFSSCPNAIFSSHHLHDHDGNVSCGLSWLWKNSRKKIEKKLQLKSNRKKIVVILTVMLVMLLPFILVLLSMFLVMMLMMVFLFLVVVMMLLVSMFMSSTDEIVLIIVN